MPAAPQAISPNEALSVLQRAFGHRQFRPGQQGIVDSLMAGNHTLAVMPTGAGKSLCFQLPALMSDGFAVVVSPLIALMENQIAHLAQAGIRAGMIHSGRDRADNVADWRAAAAGELKLLYMSPERLMTRRMLDALSRQNLSFIVVDEAHCISQWGHNFRQDYLLLGQLGEHLPGVPITAFTATADAATRADIVERLFAGKGTEIVLGFERQNLALIVEEKARANQQLLKLIRQRKGKPGIVYCRSRKGTEQTAEILGAAGHHTLAYHAGMPDGERAARLEIFQEADDLVMCATVAFGMGIDKPNIRYVLHKDVPASLEGYYQEVGRAGRDGEPAEAILLYGLGDLIVRRKMIDSSDAPEDVKRAGRGKLDAIARFVEAESCRMTHILQHFGESARRACGRCDNCIRNGIRRSAAA